MIPTIFPSELLLFVLLNNHIVREKLRGASNTKILSKVCLRAVVLILTCVAGLPQSPALKTFTDSKWCDRRITESARKLFSAGPSGPLFLSRMRTNNYYDAEGNWGIMDMLEQLNQPIIPVGVNRGVHHAFSPGPMVIDLTEYSFSMSDPSKIMLDCIVGLNTNVEPIESTATRSRRTNYPQQSTRSGHWEDIDKS